MAKEASKLTASGYAAHRKASELKGAKVPEGIEAQMALTSVNDLKAVENARKHVDKGLKIA